MAACSRTALSNANDDNDSFVRQARRAFVAGSIAYYAALLTAGQADGRFRAFDVSLMASGVRALLDVALTRVRRGDDPQTLTAELTTTVRAMTVADR